MTKRWMPWLALLPALLTPALALWPANAAGELAPRTRSLGVGASGAAATAPTAATATATAGGPRSALRPASPDDPTAGRVIVKYRDDSALMQPQAGAPTVQARNAGRAVLGGPRSARPLPQHAAALGQRLGLALRDGRVLGERVQGVQVVGLSSRALAARLAVQPDVEWAVVDQRRTATGVVPNDPLFGSGQVLPVPDAGQWYLRAPSSTLVSATNAVGAWALTTGSSAVTVAVLDTGVRLDHPDLKGKLWPGYDFVRSSIGNDGDGQDADASDPGDWTGAANSSWHGTQVSSLIAAATDNGVGMAGLGRNVMVLPVRVLGKGGGFDSDIIAGMRWAAGLTSLPVANPHPAKVINMSLGSTGSCNATANVAYRDAIAELVAGQVTVVVAAGNSNGLAVDVPANCAGAIAVAGVRHAGTKVGYSALGPEVAIAAPAGNCVNEGAGQPCLYPLITAINTGTTVPLASAYSDGADYSVGTSFATPLVAGTVALMLSVDPSLTPAQLRNALQASARPFPTTGAQDTAATTCQAPTSAEQIECYCTTSTCGAGLMDSAAALARVASGRPTVQLLYDQFSANVGTAVQLNGSGSLAPSGRSISSYLWTLSDGGSVARIESASNGPQAIVRLTAGGVYTAMLTVTDSAGVASSATVRLQSLGAPSAVIQVPTGTITAGTSFTLDGGGSSSGVDGQQLASYAWSIVDSGTGSSVVGSSSSASYTLRANSAGSVLVRLTVTDSSGRTASSSQTVTVAAAPASTSTSGGGGGGAMGAGWLLGLGLAVMALRRLPAAHAGGSARA